MHDELGGRARRLAAASLACALVIGIVFGFMNLAPLGQTTNFAPANAVAVGCVLLCLTMFALTRAGLSTRLLADLGLGFEVLGALGIALAEGLATFHPEGRVRGVSWVCLWIALFPLVVPSSPGRTLVASMASATMGLVAIHVAVLLGVPRPSFALTLYLVTPNFGAAGLAMLFSRIIHQLGRDARKAREMGSYRLIELLGRGGMGEVWRAEHRMLARPAAIKLLSPDALGGRGRGGREKQMDRARVLKRFEREARATSMLSSQSTIVLYDFGRTKDGSLYYVMELLDGIDLEALVERHGALDPARAIHLLRQICASLAEAHDSGLIHRDIKPANIYVCRLGTEHDRVKVLDFGIVALRDDAKPSGAPGSNRLTGDNAIAGTPAYLAPETVTRSEPIDHRVDLYALGCVAYWMVTGELVFEGETAVKVIFGHLESEPVAPSVRAGVALPPGLDRLILDCLAKSPSDRPATAHDVASRLDAIPLARPWTPSAAATWWAEHPPPAAPPPKSTRRARDTIIKL